MSDQKPAFWRSPLFWGVIATIAVAVFGIWSFFMPACSLGFDQQVVCTSKWFYLSRATPNEVGDTLAGFAGTFAFIWIIATVAMQSQELAAQREELELTRLEFRRMAAAQDRQVDLLVAQGAIYADEQRQRRETEANDLLDAQVKAFVSYVRNDAGPSWDYHVVNDQGGGTKGSEQIGTYLPSELGGERAFSVIIQSAFYGLNQIMTYEEQGLLIELPARRTYLRSFTERICELRETMKIASRADTIWLNELNLDLFQNALSQLDDDRYWDVSDA